MLGPIPLYSKLLKKKKRLGRINNQCGGTLTVLVLYWGPSIPLPSKIP